VTVAAGVLCDAGIALAADMKYEDPGGSGYCHTLFNLRKRSGFTASIVGTGDYDLIDAIVGEFDNCLPDAASLDELAGIVADRNLQYRERPLPRSPDPVRMPLDYSLLLGLASPAEGVRLLKMDRGGTQRVERFEIIGGSQEPAQTFVRNMYSKDMPIEEAEYLAIYAVYKGKTAEEGSPGETDCTAILADGTRKTLSARIVKQTEEYIEAFTHAFDIKLPPALWYNDETGVLEAMLKDYILDLLRRRQELRELRKADYYK